MPPIQQSELGKAIQNLLSRLPKLPPLNAGTFNCKPMQKKSRPTQKYKPVNPLQTIVKGLSSTISQISKSTAKEDYHSVVKSFIPSDAVLLKPKYPANSKSIDFADIDGDSENELIASYRDNEGINTLVLKKHNGIWNKAGHIKNIEYETLYYRNITKLGNAGKKQLLLGFTSKEQNSRLHGYSHEGENLNQLFAIDYSRFEVLKDQTSRNGPVKHRLAVWNSNEKGTHDVEILDWNGLHFDPVKVQPSYYYNNVVPYYAAKIKQKPNYISNWYNLSHALVKAGAKRDALIAVNVGMYLDNKSVYKERFESLKGEIDKI